MKQKQFLLSLLLVLGLSFLAWTFLMLDGKLVGFDLTIIHFVQGHISTFHSKVLLLFTNIGSTTGVVIILSFITFGLLFMQYRAFSLYLALVSALSSLLNTTLKHLIERPRPTLLRLLHESSYSYPSGHAMAAASLYLSLGYVVFRLSENKRIRGAWVAFGAFMIVSIGLSRIYFGVHYPSDILAGYLCGTIWVIISTWVFTKIEKLFPEKLND